MAMGRGEGRNQGGRENKDAVFLPGSGGRRPANQPGGRPADQPGDTETTLIAAAR